jgi:hypothetical protein
MTPEQLTRLVLEGDIDALVEGLAPLEETQRRALSKCAQQLRRQLERGEAVDSEPAEAGALLEKLKLAVGGSLASARRFPNGYRRYTAADLAVLGVGPLSAARRLQGFFFDESDQEALRRILVDRRPSWLGDWIAHQLEQEWSPIRWPLMRELVRSGACTRPDTPGYARLFANEMRGQQRRGQPPPAPLSERLRGDPELLDHEVWRLFEVDTPAFAWDWEGKPHAPENYESWATALVKLAASGDLDRARLLDASLSGLTTGFGPNVLSGFHKLHTRLAPSVEELASREERYAHLLGSPVGHVAAFALKLLAALQKAGRLDADSFLAEVPAVFSIASKGPSLQALRLIKRIARSDKALAPAASRAAAEALIHPSADVQTAALDLLESLSDGATGERELADLVRERIDHVAPALRTRAQLLAPTGEDREAPFDAAVHETEGRLEALRERIRVLDPVQRERVGLAVEADTLPPPLDFAIRDARLLTGVERIAPIESLEQLIDAVAHAVEEVDSADEVERILDALSRLCDQRPADFGLRTGALAKRIAEPPQSDVPRGLASSWGGAPLLFQDLLLAWLEDRPRRTRQTPWYRSTGVYPFFAHRLQELGARVLQRRAAPLLAAPTHCHGWIEPRALVERWLALQAADASPLRSDWVQALLRIAPDEREPALVAAAALEGDPGRLLRFALGGDEVPTRRDRRAAALWIAAGRARDPDGSLAESLAPLGRLELGPDALEPAHYTWRAESESRRYSGREVKLARLALEVTPAAPGWGDDDDAAVIAGYSGAGFGGAIKRLAARGASALKLGPEHRLRELPTVGLHRAVSRSWQTPDLHATWIIRWTSMLWPLSTDGALAAGIRSMLERVDMDAASSAPNFAHLEVLFEPDRPWSELGVLALWLGLIARDADVRGLAVDALVEGIDDGRAHPRPLSDVLCRLVAGGWVKLNRLTESLASVAAVSPLHRLVVAEVLEALLSQATLPKRGLHQPLELLLDVCSQLARPVGAPARKAFEAIAGSGKAARLARALLALETQPVCTEPSEALVRALEARIERADRWGAPTSCEVAGAKRRASRRSASP